MLKRLEIQNYAIIDRLELDLPEGLAIITGETGAGKSILLGALNLVLGKRADSKVMYDPDKKCYVEAVFDISSMDFGVFFTDHEIDEASEFIIRREISPGGKSRSFLNDSPVTLDVLEEISSLLIDVHQQFDTHGIQKPSYQLDIIDALAGNKKRLQEYQKLYQTYKTTAKRLEELKEKSRNASQEMEFLSFQLKELEEASLRENEQEDLEARLQKLSAAEDIKRISSLIVHSLSEEEQAIIPQLQSLASQLSSLSHIDSAFESLHARLLSVREELLDMSRECQRISDKTDYDEESIHETQTRLSLIYRLQKKHQVSTMEELMGVLTALRSKLEGFGDISGHIQTLEQACADMEKELIQQAGLLSEARKSVFANLEQKTHELLAELSMEHAHIRIRHQLSGTLTKSGTDEISILFSANKGGQFQPLKDVASGGELSRLALCIKSLVAGAMTLPTLIFDEIDAGVSGQVARKMGEILDQLSKKHQVICITHSPQVAARADRHYWVYKSDTPTRTLTALKELSHEERTIEIAKMLSGNPPSEAAIANARELIAL